MVGYYRVIPNQFGFNSSGSVIKARDYARWLEAKALLDEAGEEAERLKKDVRDSYDAERERGYQEGLESAKLEMSEQTIEVVGRIVKYISAVENDMVEVVMRSLERILGKLDKEDLIVDVVKNALATVRNQKRVTLRVAPQQLETVQKRVNDILAAFPMIVDLDIAADSRLPDNGCILESDIGTVDASLEGQLTTLRASFEKMFGERH